MALEATLAVVVYLVGRWTTAARRGECDAGPRRRDPGPHPARPGELLNPDYFPTIIPEDGEKVGSIVGVLTGFAIAGIAIWDIVDVLDQDRARAPLKSG